MDAGMVHQGAALSEAFTTGLATEGPFTRVHTNVGGQSTLPSKCPTTGVAAEGLVPSVGAHMILEVRQTTKGTRTGRTGKGPFVGMDAAVNCQVSRMPGAEPLPTLAAPHATMRAPAGLAQARRTRKRHHTAPVWIQNRREWPPDDASWPNCPKRCTGKFVYTPRAGRGMREITVRGGRRRN